MDDPQRALTDHFHKEMDDMERAEKKEKQKTRWSFGEHSLPRSTCGKCRCWEGFILTKSVCP